jgi:hypothetical protein
MVWARNKGKHQMKHLIFALSTLALLGTVIPAQAGCPAGTRYDANRPLTASNLAAAANLKTLMGKRGRFAGLFFVDQGRGRK